MSESYIFQFSIFFRKCERSIITIFERFQELNIESRMVMAIGNQKDVSLRLEVGNQMIFVRECVQSAFDSCFALQISSVLVKMETFGEMLLSCE